MYQLWHQYELVLEVQGESIVVHLPDKLPFDLRHEAPISFNHFNLWLNRRLTTISRTYMNKLYMQRRVGRSHSDIIRDSAAIAPVDLFWVTMEGLSHTWESLQVMRDERMETARVSLEGILDESVNPFAQEKKDHISIFATKGAFPKAIYQKHLLKKGDNAEYEVSAYKLGYKLGFDVAKAEEYAEGAIACTLFTDEQTSLVHASELLYPFNAPSQKDIYTKALDRFKGEPMERQLQRLFMFNYLVSNNDLHGENFGFLYSPKTFELLCVAPAYDFNSAFEGWRGVELYDPDIFTRLSEFINNNLDLIPTLSQVAEFLATDPYLNQTQKDEIILRADYLISLTQNN